MENADVLSESKNKLNKLIISYAISMVYIIKNHIIWNNLKFSLWLAIIIYNITPVYTLVRSEKSVFHSTFIKNL